ncbi:MAG: ABC transporter permease [Caldilineae bacterium]|nr:ABC transporter permease [Chloroflexota bacterium]MCB9176005.1 ABC transporter permease [Caldilineae bacterium]
MTGYLIRRGIQMVIVLLISSIAIYSLLLAAPGGPFSGLKQLTGSKDRVSDAQIANMERLLGLHLPPQMQYLAWLAGDDWMGSLNKDWEGHRKGVLRGDFGKSFKQNRPVITLIEERLPNTIKLMAASGLLAILVAVPIGVFSAVRQYSKLDYTFTFATFVGIAIPNFWFGLMMIIIFGNLFKSWGLPFLPTGGTESVRIRPGSLQAVLGVSPGTAPDQLIHLILPTLTLSLSSMAGWGRFVRASMLEVLRQDYVRTARAKGLTERVVVAKHALRNALIPLVTIVTFELPAMFGGAILTETVFSYPGMGRLYIQGLLGFDYPVAQGFLVITAVLVVVATLMSDVLYTVVDPRIRFS